MAEPIACQCTRGAPACKRLATQEDLRCDVCRGGCSQIGFGPVGTAPEQIEMTSHWEQPEVTWVEESPAGLLDWGWPEPIIIDDPPPPPGAHPRDYRGLFLRGAEIDSAPPATREHANRPESPPSDRISPHVRTPGPTSNPRNENP